MANYLAIAEYGAKTGVLRTWSGNVEAADMTEAHAAASKLLRRERRVARLFKLTVYPPVAVPPKP
jgi:hypothetical protein